jgi:hypothetical protein
VKEKQAATTATIEFFTKNEQIIPTRAVKLYFRPWYQGRARQVSENKATRTVKSRHSENISSF